HLLRIAKRMKVLLFPGLLFEEMGFTYLGPVDGHDLPKLIEILQGVKSLKGPVLLHVVTKKGRGYEKAENEPIKYHGVTKWNPETGEMVKGPATPPTYTKVFSQTLCRMAKEDDRIVAITAAMPEGTGLDAFRDQIEDRYFDVGLGEQHAVTFAAGLACGGLKPVVAIYSTFLQRAFDQIEHDVALQKLPVLFCLDRGGFAGDDGATHHGAFDLSYLRMIPNLTIMAPKDENELQHMMKTALNYRQGPVAIRYPRGAGEGVAMDTAWHLLPWGRGEVVREGEGIAVLAIGNTVHPSIRAAEIAAKSGVNARVINARFVKPLEKDWLLEALAGVKRVITVEENAVAGGFGSAVRELLADCDIPIRSLGIPDRFIEHGPQPKLRALVGLSEPQIADAILAVAGASKASDSSSLANALPTA
ncbi:MAG: 1-deoxy-D-xylulose-5-phosphate synthase, partial [Elusimicrobia bacterium]|nr:1-deoxy-D-xylulose-5-phosphate synthase [Elusimicrobiota bacterium]